jgi:hypothetical protein
MKRTYHAALFGLAIALTAAAAQATSPPPSWTNLRVITCDGDVLTTYLAPPGFGTPFNIVGSTNVIIPKFVRVTTPQGMTFVTLNVPGFNPDGPDVVECSYVDPVGLLVEFLGIRK